MRSSLGAAGASVHALSARIIMALAIAATLVMGLVLVLVGAPDVHTVATVVAAILRSSWGAILNAGL